MTTRSSMGVSCIFLTIRDPPNVIYCFSAVTLLVWDEWSYWNGTLLEVIVFCFFHVLSIYLERKVCSIEMGLWLSAALAEWLSDYQPLVICVFAKYRTGILYLSPMGFALLADVVFVSSSTKKVARERNSLLGYLRWPPWREGPAQAVSGPLEAETCPVSKPTEYSNVSLLIRLIHIWVYTTVNLNGRRFFFVSTPWNSG